MKKSIITTGWLLAALITVAGARQSQQTLKPADPSLSVPAGFEVELVAGPPLVERPIVADFDEQGRLYVADSSGSNARVADQLAERPHRIVRLEDKDGDGRFDTSVVFADKMMFPEGTMWFDGSLYVAAPPSIWKLTDTNNDGVADTREEWFQGKTLTNCANDLHGPYLGPDGLIYWTKGAFAEQTYERPGKAPLVTRASHVFRRRPGDTAIESVMTGGMDNPVDVAWTPSGERIVTATFLEHPQLGRRDAVFHAVYGGLYGKPHAVVEGHKRTGDLMPVMTHLGPAVPAGLTRYTSRVFGDDYRDNFFAAMFNLRKVTRNVLQPSGATFKNQESDFLVSTNRDFHPTDVLEDADGSLLVVDTGPWYKLCCPTSQLAKPDLPGAIYRVRRQGPPALKDPRGLQLAWTSMTPADLVKLIDDSRPAVTSRAIQQLARIGQGAVRDVSAVLRTSATVAARRNALWTLTRIDSPQARESLRGAMADADHSIRLAAMYAAGLWRDAGARTQLVAALKSGAPDVQRAAAEALGRIGDASAVPDLVAAAAGKGTDRVLEHSLIYALIEIGQPAPTLGAGQQAGSSAARRVALIAADQMDNGGLSADAILPLLDSTDAVLKETAWWIAGRHSAWGGSFVPYFERRLAATSLSAADRDDLQQKIAQFGDNASIQALLATAASAPSPAVRSTALAAMGAAARGRMKVLPAGWIAALSRAVVDADGDVAKHAVAVVRAVPAPPEHAAALREALLGVARDRARPLEVRLDALGAAQNDPALGIEPDLFDFLRAGLDPARPAMVRSAASAIVERTRLNRSQLTDLTDLVKQAGPLELPRLLRAYDSDGDEALGLRLLTALETSAARASLRPEILKPRLAKYPPAVQQRADALLAIVNVDATKQAQRLNELEASTGGGDIRRGQAVFNSEKTACLRCHAIGYIGGKAGPDLTRIGQVRSERDLLESIVYPSSSFVRSYEPMMIEMRSGAVHTGVVRSEQRDDVVLATGPADEVRLARQDISDMRASPVSLMPGGYGEQLTRQELADLVAFLKASR